MSRRRFRIKFDEEITTRTCGSCGACCMVGVGWPPFTDRELVKLKRDHPALAREIEQKKAQSKEYGESFDEAGHRTSDVEQVDEVCIWFDKDAKPSDTPHACTRNNIKPDICKNFGVDSSDCRTVRREYVRIETQKPNHFEPQNPDHSG